MTFTNCLDCGMTYAAPRPESCCDLCDFAMSAIIDGRGNESIAKAYARNVREWAEDHAYYAAKGGK